jgi:hypothetical protein
MRPLFTVHAGEFLVGSAIERLLPRARVWVPAKDTGVDLLVTNSGMSRTASLQVKHSRDYSMSHVEGIVASGWWTLKMQEIQESPCDLWVFVLVRFDPRRGLDLSRTHYVVIPPAELRLRVRRIHGRQEKVQFYLGVTGKRRCWDTRGLTKSDEIRIASGVYRDNTARDFTRYLDDWTALARRLRP